MLQSTASSLRVYISSWFGVFTTADTLNRFWNKVFQNQRKVDIELCEQFTRCRSSKGKGRYSCYEYTDIDTQLVVDFDEFERR